MRKLAVEHLDFLEQKRAVLVEHLRRHVQGEVRFDAATRKLYSTDASIYQITPLGVVIPRTMEDLRTAVQIAAEMQLPITARGGGTSLSGQAIGSGLVIDCSKYLHAILEIDPVARSVRVQPGVVLDQLNRALGKHNLQFGPDVATASRANLGGMIGNNSAGARSIVYGKTCDHTRGLNVILADGSLAAFGPVSKTEWERRASLRSLEGSIYAVVRRIVQRNSGEIQTRFPRILRRVSGYNLDLLANGLASEQISPSAAAATTGLHQLVVGSEGTLAVVTEAELSVVPRPKFRGLLVPHFVSMAAAMDALDACLEFKPSAVELLDGMLLDLARGNLSLKDCMAAVQGRPAALLMVEFSGDTAAEVADRVERLERRMREVTGVSALIPALTPSLRDPLWNLRSAAVPLLLGLPGDRKPVTFVEDTAVAPERLPEYVARFQELLARHGASGAFYGHASVGCLHIRPVLNLKDPADVARMRRIASDVTDLVLEFGGALSGEHGDGLARSEWNQKLFGPVVYEAFRQVKQVFDPHHLLNPGRVVDAAPMTENLRYGTTYRPVEPATFFDYSRQEGLARSIELCNGSGVCRKMQGGAMCPSYRATRDEKDSTRGRANALRLALSGNQPFKDLRSRWLYDVLDLCLMCKACKSECPSNVDMAKLKAEFLHFYYEGRLRPLSHFFLAHLHQAYRLGASAASLLNWLQSNTIVRWILEKTAGFDRRRRFPTLHAQHFRRWFTQRRRRQLRGIERSNSATSRAAEAFDPVQKVVLLDDCFTTYNEPCVGQAATRVLERAGCEIELAGLVCCGRTLISKGFLAAARELIQQQAPRLAARLAGGIPLLGLEPSCLLTLTDEWPELVPSAETRHIAKAAKLADLWLAQEVQAGNCRLELTPDASKCLVQVHCHQKALCGGRGTIAALQLIPGLEPISLDAGCCGMAGSFGYEREHFNLSVQIAELELLPQLAQEPELKIVATGTSCRHQINDLTGRRARHPLEVLDAALTSRSI